MKVKEIRKEIENIEKTINILHDINSNDIQLVFDNNDIEKLYPGANWRFAKLQIINSMVAYKNILKERIENAEIICE